ncbi:hypothetical protein PMI26_01966 [Pseudomonas sp. GM33]|nr:hypothetical protein PMI26_01966 [Pseudomonas sp. GM33]
MRAQCASEVD